MTKKKTSVTHKVLTVVGTVLCIIFNTDPADKYYADRKELHKQGRGAEHWRDISFDRTY